MYKPISLLNKKKKNIKTKCTRFTYLEEAPYSLGSVEEDGFINIDLGRAFGGGIEGGCVELLVGGPFMAL